MNELDEIRMLVEQGKPMAKIFRVTEYYVVGMSGYPDISGVYSTAKLGDDALKAVMTVWKSRGGTVMCRTIDTGEWAPIAYRELDKPQGT